MLSYTTAGIRAVSKVMRKCIGVSPRRSKRVAIITG